MLARQLAPQAAAAATATATAAVSNSGYEFTVDNDVVRAIGPAPRARHMQRRR